MMMGRGVGQDNQEEITCSDLIGPLNEIEKKYAPSRLYVRGDTSIAQHGPRVAIIGARDAHGEALKNTAILTNKLVKHNIVIVSGLAKGIDTCAHRTVIDQGGKTIAVLGTPLNRCYPAENCHLQQEIMENHLAVSQFSPGSSIQRANFPLRNRTMALISHASVIMEASDSSGSLHQGWEALRLGRPLLIFEEILKNKHLKWPEEMMKYGAIVLSMNKIEMLLEMLPAHGGVMDIGITI